MTNKVSLYFRQEEEKEMNKHSLQIIGLLKSHGVWLGRYGGQIVIYHPIRAQEMIIYYRLMTHHSLPTEKLEQPIILNAR